MAEYTTVTEDIDFIPEFDDNEKEKEPITVVLKYMTSNENAKCLKIYGDLDIDYETTITLGVKEVKNLKVDGKEITTARQLLNLSGFRKLLDEVVVKIISMNARTDKKN